MISTDELERLRHRIEIAYSPELVRLTGRKLIDSLADYYESAQASQGDVLPWCDPPVHEKRAADTLAGCLSRDADPGQLGQFQLALRRRVVEKGEFYIVSTKLDGNGALRITVMNPLTTPDHLDMLLDAIRHNAKTLLEESR